MEVVGNVAIFYNSIVDRLLILMKEVIKLILESIKKSHPLQWLLAEVVKDLDKPASEHVLSLITNSRNSAVALVSKAIFNARYKNNKTLIRTLDIRNYKDAVRDLPDLNQAEFWVNLGSINYELQNFETAIQLYDLARKVFEKKGMEENVANIDMNQARVYYSIGKYETALELYNKARTLFENKRMEDEVAYIDWGKAKIYKDLGKYDDALDLYSKARTVFEKKGMEVEVACIDANQADVYSNLGKYETALEWYEKARTVFEKEGMEEDVAKIDANLEWSLAKVVKDLDEPESEQVLSQLANSRNSAVALVSKAIFNARYKNNKTLIRTLDIRNYK
ncbi:MAG: tetratricopeptide repeat protein, partial [Methanosarcinales archaeon]